MTTFTLRLWYTNGIFRIVRGFHTVKDAVDYAMMEGDHVERYEVV